MTHDTERLKRAMLAVLALVADVLLLCLFYFVISGHELETVNWFTPGFDWQDDIFVILEFVKIKLIIFGQTTWL